MMKIKEFSSLRHAGEWVRDMPTDHIFIEIHALDIVPLTEQEKAALILFADGKIELR